MHARASWIKVASNPVSRNNSLCTEVRQTPAENWHCTGTLRLLPLSPCFAHIWPYKMLSVFVEERQCAMVHKKEKCLWFWFWEWGGKKRLRREWILEEQLKAQTKKKKKSTEIVEFRENKQDILGFPKFHVPSLDPECSPLVSFPWFQWILTKGDSCKKITLGQSRIFTLPLLSWGPSSQCYNGWVTAIQTPEIL